MNSFRSFRASADIPAGFAVAFILIPQSLAYAELAGMPAERGLIAAAAAPIAAAFFASSPYLQTGPTALTTILTFVALASVATPGTHDFVFKKELSQIHISAALQTTNEWFIINFRRPKLKGSFINGSCNKY